jgi:hypothetical protein
VAYIDATHLEAYSGNPSSYGGLGELSRILMRNGYLPLVLTDFDAAHLERAGLLISIAPGRPFSPGERQGVKDFVYIGGILISMVGAEEESASRGLLADFGLSVPPMPLPPSRMERETEPLGSFSQEFAGKNHMVQFHAAWPVAGDSESESLVVWGERKHADHPVIVSRNSGKGYAVLIGDTRFAMNENLAVATGGVPNNADFWRWMLTRMTGEAWKPPSEKPGKSKPGAEPAESGPLDAPNLGGKDAKEGRL